MSLPPSEVGSGLPVAKPISGATCHPLVMRIAMPLPIPGLIATMEVPKVSRWSKPPVAALAGPGTQRVLINHARQFAGEVPRTHAVAQLKLFCIVKLCDRRF